MHGDARLSHTCDANTRKRPARFGKRTKGHLTTAAPIISAADQHPPLVKEPKMLWTILIIALIILVVMAILGRGRFSR
jgi:hypothetical protein